jgi:predicted ester cyclase
MRTSYLVAAFGLWLVLATGCTSATDEATTADRSATAAVCPTTTEAENVAIARVFHEEAINRPNVTALQDILHPQVMHHAAGGYRDFMTADDVAAMMAEFPAAFSDLRIDIDFWAAENDLVVERYTATGTQDGPLQDLAPSGRRATWTGINIFRVECGRIAEIWSEVDAISRRQQLTGAT